MKYYYYYKVKPYWNESKMKTEGFNLIAHHFGHINYQNINWALHNVWIKLAREWSANINEMKFSLPKPYIFHLYTLLTSFTWIESNRYYKIRNITEYVLQNHCLLIIIVDIRNMSSFQISQNGQVLLRLRPVGRD